MVMTLVSLHTCEVSNVQFTGCHTAIHAGMADPYPIPNSSPESVSI